MSRRVAVASRGMRRAALPVVLLISLAAPAAASAQRVEGPGGVYAEVTDGAVALGNDVAERRWSRAAMRTTALVDKRAGGRSWSAGSPDFRLRLAGVDLLTSDLFSVASAEVKPLARGGLRVTMRLGLGPGEPVGLWAERIAEVYPGIAGFRTQTVLHSAAPLALGSYTLDEAALGAATPTIHALRAGSDWREPGWQGPALTLGDPHAGTWRDSRSGGRGEALKGAAQWISAADGDRALFMVAERNDLPSSRAAYDGTSASLLVDYARDILSLGPLEESGHVENPTDLPLGRLRVVLGDHALEPAFIGFADGAGDEAWQFHRYLVGHRVEPYRHDVVFNSDGDRRQPDLDRRQGRHGHRDRARGRRPARALGVETFVLDDGWQAISGDWQPDSPAASRAAREVPAALPRRRVRRRARGDRPDAARPVDEPDALQPRVGDLRGASRVGLRAGRPGTVALGVRRA